MRAERRLLWRAAAFSFLLSFARDNELKTRPGRKDKRPEEAAAGGAPAA